MKRNREPTKEEKEMQSTYVEEESDDVWKKEVECKRGERLRDTDLLLLGTLDIGTFKERERRL